MSVDLPPLVIPFAGERYAAMDRLTALLAPPYDVISRAERVGYAARDPHNIVHLILPEAPSGADQYADAAARLTAWRREGVLRRDAGEAVYVVAQDYTLPSGERRTRLGMFAAVRAEPFATRRVRPHEQTHSAPKADRLALLRATRTSLESIFLLAPDSDRALAQALAQAARGVPAARAELDGVGIRMWSVTGAPGAELAALAGRAQLYIADGHHRYETAVAFAAEDPRADRLLSFIVSRHDPGLTILPTHRIVFGAGRDAAKLIEQWRAWFEVGRVAPCMDRVERLAELGRDRTACIVAFPDDYDVTLVLKPDAALDRVPGMARTPAVRALDVVRIETLVVQYILGAGTATPSLAYTPDPRAAFEAVRNGRAAAAVLLNPTKVEQVFAVADAGDVMPPKSTYFAPKVPAGLVLRALA
ncbi:MAG: hypothetical protein AUI88_01745 [Gemmatimonadetes bacterium 13_1_40CM_3_70_8]|nr:MAG: hypothetical protein AUI88_01745 [Gemmatimonadetes bacterium 13_1_40CM_3_70_8]